MRCLIAQSDPTLCAMICDTLEEMGHSATCAETAADALYRVNRTRYDLVVLDHALPARDSGRLAQAAIEKSPDIRVLTLTGAELFPNRGHARFAPAIMAMLAPTPAAPEHAAARGSGEMKPELAWLS